MDRPLRWLIIGMGRAGRARARDIAASADHHLIDALSARAVGPPHSAGTTACLANSNVDAVIIATENRSHRDWAEASLQAGHHTLVEFPLCTTSAEAESLYALAETQGKVLHTELIGLLSESFKSLCTRLDNSPAQLHSRFTGGLERWVADEMLAGHLGQLSVARLHALWRLAGPLTLREARVSFHKGGYRLETQLLGHRGMPVQLPETRAPAMARKSSLVATLVDGSRLERGAIRRGEALFAADLAMCASRIRHRDGRGIYVSNQEVVAVLALAEAINVACGLP